MLSVRCVSKFVEDCHQIKGNALCNLKLVKISRKVVNTTLWRFIQMMGMIIQICPDGFILFPRICIVFILM